MRKQSVTRVLTPSIRTGVYADQQVLEIKYRAVRFYFNVSGLTMSSSGTLRFLAIRYRCEILVFIFPNSIRLTWLNSSSHISANFCCENPVAIRKSRIRAPIFFSNSSLRYCFCLPTLQIECLLSYFI